jgi:hypothetical protein
LLFFFPSLVRSIIEIALSHTRAREKKVGKISLN